MPIVERERHTAVAAEQRLKAGDALSTVPVEAQTDAMPDFANALRATTTGRVDPVGTRGKVNRAPLELVACFVIAKSPATAASTAP